MSEPAARADLERLERRIDMIDQGGTRGVGMLAVQVTEIAKDLAKLEQAIDQHRGEHQADIRARVASRRWIIAMIITAIAAVDGPLITVILGH